MKLFLSKTKPGNKNLGMITLLFAATYMVSYITRINYGAIITEMVSATGFSKSQLSMALTGSFITYGVGQIISGICGDHFSPKKLVSFGLLITISMNLLVPICKTPAALCVVWCVNGFAQSFMWPPLVRIMANILTDDEYKIVTTKVTFGSSFGTIAVYMLSPLLISCFGWKSVFLASATCGVVMLLLWNVFLPDISQKQTKQVEGHTKTMHKGQLFDAVFISIMAVIVLQGMLRDGVTTWMPTYISETYHLGSTASILTGVVLPVFAVVCIQVSSKLYIKKFQNPIQCALVLFAFGTVAAVALYCFSGQNAIFSVIFSAMLTDCMHGSNLMLTGMVPSFYKDRGNVATVSGILNACTYVGSALSTYGIAVLAENKGWNVTLLIWIAIAFTATALCGVCVKPWKTEAKEI